MKKIKFESSYIEPHNKEKLRKLYYEFENETNIKEKQKNSLTDNEKLLVNQIKQTLKISQSKKERIRVIEEISKFVNNNSFSKFIGNSDYNL
jgi:hypothetical protein